jgi:predicted site-specific integrase-resolvase
MTLQTREILTTHDAAKILGIQWRRTIQLAEDGHLKCLRARNGTRLYRIEDVEQLAEHRAKRGR